MIAYAVVSKRPPLLGYNHNVRHAGRLFHVQTEDSGLTRLYVTTHLFLDGTILSTARGQYTADEPDDVVQKKMQVQHKTMLKRLRDGDFDHGDDATLRHRAKSAGESSGELAIPRELANDAAQATLRLAVPGSSSSEAVRPVTAPSGPILAPVAPPPMPPRNTNPSSSLAERLRRNTGGAPSSVPPPPPVPGTRPTAVGAPPTPAPPVEPQAVLEFEADLPEDDDLDPAVTIEVTEPTHTDPAPPDPTLSFGAASFPLPPGTAPPVTAAGPPAAMSQTGSPRWSSPGAPAAPPAVAPPAPVSAPPPPLPVLPVRPLPASGLRTKPTAEGVVLQRTLVPTPLQRPGSDSLRTTSPRARPTAPAPLAVAQAIHPLDDERSLDPVVLAYLAREVRPRDA